jgi:hypothetical protein
VLDHKDRRGSTVKERAAIERREICENLFLTYLGGPISQLKSVMTYIIYAFTLSRSNRVRYNRLDPLPALFSEPTGSTPMMRW